MNKINEFKILEYMKREKGPVGAVLLSNNLNIAQTTIGRKLLELEKNGNVEKKSNKGRIITEKGIRYLNSLEEEVKKIDLAVKMANVYNEISKEKLIEILEVRKILEKGSVVLACENASKEDMIELDIILAKHKVEIKSNRLGNEEDLKLHLKLAKMGGNQTLYDLCKLLLTNDNAYTKFSIVSKKLNDNQFKQHEKIVEAVKKRNKEEAKQHIVNHLNQIIQDVKKYM